MTKVFEKNQRVRFVKKPENATFDAHYTLALEYIDRGKIYVVEHYFAGDPSQIELRGIDAILFMAEMFENVE